MSSLDIGYKAMASYLLGRTMVVGTKQVTILDAKGFPRAENDTGVYKPVVSMRPGEVFVPRHRNAFLFLVATLDGADTGGCVLVREIEMDGMVVNGPGRVTQALGIQQHGATGNLTEDEHGYLLLKMDGVLPKAVAPANGKKPRPLSRKQLELHMPKIVKYWKQHKQGTPFLGFVDEVLENCKDETALRKYLKEPPK